MKYMILQISLPPIMNVGTFAAEINWKVSSKTWSPAKFNLTVGSALLRIQQITPVAATQQEGAIIEFEIFGLPALIDLSSLFVSLDGIAANMSSAQLANSRSLKIFITFPRTYMCRPVLSVEYTTYAQSYLAQASLLLVGPDPVAVCILGCSKSMESNELQLAVLTLQSTLLEELFFSVTDLNITCFFSVDQISSFEYTCTALFLNATQVQSCAHNRQLLCANLSIMYGSESDSVAALSGALLNTKVQAYIGIAHSKFSNLCVLASVNFLQGPLLLNASFSSDFSSLVICFDQDVKVLQFTAKCSNWFKYVSEFGVNSMCIWSTPSKIIVFLGHNASLAPFDQVTLLGPIRSLNSIAVTSRNQKFQVLPPLQAILPKISIVGPKTVSACDTAQLRVLTSSNRMKYVWRCQHDLDLNALLLNLSPADSVQINGSFLKSSKLYMITVLGLHDFGVYSDTAVHELALTLKHVPQLIINLQPPPYFSIQHLFFTASVTYAECSLFRSPLEFVWILYNQNQKSDGNQREEIFQVTGPSVGISSGTLNATNYYVMTLFGLSTNGSSFAEHHFYVTMQSIVSTITGGNRYTFIGDKITLDASKSYNPNLCRYEENFLSASTVCNQAQSLKFKWECFLEDQTTCTSKDGSRIVFEPTPQIQLDLKSIELRNSNVKIFVTVYDVFQSAGTSVLINVATTTSIDVQIQVLYKTAQGLALKGVVEQDKEQRFIWNIITPSGSFSDLKEDSTFLTGQKQEIFVVRFDTQVGLGTFQKGVTYEFHLQAVNSVGSGQSLMNIYIPVPPYGGVCTVSPTEGMALSTEFKIHCTEWTGETTPLQYAFSGTPLSLVESENLIWSQQITTASYGMYFIDGIYSIRAMVFDAEGFSTLSANTVVNVTSSFGSSIFPPNRISNFLSMLLLSSKISQFLSLIGAIGASLGSDYPEQTCSSSRCRRLLASSKSYRLAVRKLLLQKLSPIANAISNAATGPTYIKILKTIALNPAELDDFSTLSMSNQFDISSGALNAQGLRSGSLADVMKLGLSILLAAKSRLNADGLGTTNANAVSTILKSGSKYSTTMVQGERQFFSNFSDISLQVLGFNLSSESLSRSPVAAVTNYSTLARNRPFDGLSISVVRLSPTISIALAGSENIRSETLGIQILESESLNVSSKWSCPESNKYCIRFPVQVQISDLNHPPELSCFLWNGHLWDNSQCRMGGTTADNGSDSKMQVNCWCNNDGIYKISGVVEVNEVWHPSPLQIVSVVRTHYMQTVYLLFIIPLILVVLSLLGICSGIYLLSKLSPTIPYSKSELLGKFAQVQGSGLSGIDEEIFEQFTHDFGSVMYCYYPRFQNGFCNSDVFSRAQQISQSRPVPLIVESLHDSEAQTLDIGSIIEDSAQPLSTFSNVLEPSEVHAWTAIDHNFDSALPSQDSFLFYPSMVFRGDYA
jgi:hypothetical protein